MMERLSLVSHNDLLYLLDYAQGAGRLGPRIVARRLREQAEPTLWDIDSVQFVRLLGEIFATIEITNEDWANLATSMDLEDEQLQELIDRAQTRWDEVKAAI
jgi:phospholipid N-methyltransferase